MEEKYLPIGSVVNVKGLNKKMMIIGYYSLEYQNSVKIYDYVGCNYPEGMLLKNNLFSFNHSDIVSCDFVGYKDATYATLNNNLNNQLQSDSKNMEQPKNFLNLKFDENGVVVYEEMSPVKKAPEIVKKAAVINPFDLKNATVEVKSEAPVMKDAFKFDENGVVIEDNTVKANKKDIESNFRYTFDENGFVTGETRIGEVKNDKKTDEVQYLFDENGFVIGEEKVGKVDANKRIINNVATKPEEQPKRNDFQMPHYRFDENGIIISE